MNLHCTLNYSIYVQTWVHIFLTVHVVGLHSRKLFHGKGSPVRFFNPVIPTQIFAQSHNPKGYFWHSSHAHTFNPNGNSVVYLSDINNLINPLVIIHLSMQLWIPIPINLLVYTYCELKLFNNSWRAMKGNHYYKGALTLLPLLHQHVCPFQDLFCFLFER